MNNNFLLFQTNKTFLFSTNQNRMQVPPPSLLFQNHQHQQTMIQQTNKQIIINRANKTKIKETKMNKIKMNKNKINKQTKKKQIQKIKTKTSSNYKTVSLSVRTMPLKNNFLFSNISFFPTPFFNNIFRTSTKPFLTAGLNSNKLLLSSPNYLRNSNTFHHNNKTPKTFLLTKKNKKIMSNNISNNNLLLSRTTPMRHPSPSPQPTSHNHRRSKMREQSVMRLLLNYNPNNNNNNRLPSPLIPLQQRMMSMWAKSTNDRRRYLQLQLEEFMEKNPHYNFPIATMACLMLHEMSQKFQKKNTNKKKVIANSLHTYAKEIRTMLKKMNHETMVLDQMVKVYAIEANNDPLHQATPVTRSQVEFLIKQAMNLQDVKLAVMIYLMWKTASRYDDVANLTSDCVLSHNNNQIILKWGKLKTSKQSPHRMHNWIVIQEDNYPELLLLAQEVLQNPQNFPNSNIITPRPPRQTTNNSINNLRIMLQHQQQQSQSPENINNNINLPLSSVTYNALIKFLHLFPQTQQLTAHSFKRGALGHLINMAVQGHLEDPRLITIMAKHKDELHDFPTTTVRYAPNPTAFALMIGTQKATKLL